MHLQPVEKWPKLCIGSSIQLRSSSLPHPSPRQHSHRYLNLHCAHQAFAVHSSGCQIGYVLMGAVSVDQQDAAFSMRTVPAVGKSILVHSPPFPGLPRVVRRLLRPHNLPAPSKNIPILLPGVLTHSNTSMAAGSQQAWSVVVLPRHHPPGLPRVVRRLLPSVGMGYVKTVSSHNVGVIRHTTIKKLKVIGVRRTVHLSIAAMLSSRRLLQDDGGSPSNRSFPYACGSIRPKTSWRRERDSNPRTPCEGYAISSRAPSTTRPSLRGDCTQQQAAVHL